MAVVLIATMSLDGFIARPDDSVGPIFDWFTAGDTDVHAGDEQRPFRTGRESADWLREQWGKARSGVIGRHLFDHTNGWEGRPPAGEHVVVLTHSVPSDWPHYGTAPFTFVTEGVEAAVAAARDRAGDGDVTVTAGDVGGQALAAGLIDEVEIDLAPVVLGRGKRFFGEDAPEVVLDDPYLVVPGNRVTHFRYKVRKIG
ncbi:dihydrofolate reductase family protein [Actinomycetospora flava]|uniref:Dihydrofolate reductase family protein n=1 Tax=Actinomycetospora flava TaxID=3129232 RepID=A0ABU8MCZ7_9PSEU